MIQFTLGIAVALLTGVLVWMFVTLYKLNKKFKQTLKELDIFNSHYYKNRDDDRNHLSKRFDDMHRYMHDEFVTKEKLKQDSKNLLKG
jgi:hypothetical protein